MNCIACEGSDLVDLFTARDINNRPFDYLKCPICGTVQLTNPSEELFDYAYDQAYYGGSGEKFKWPFSALFALSKKLAAKKLAARINSKDSSILDIGCGTGSFLTELNQLGYSNLWGNEINSPAKAPDHITWLPGMFSEIDLKEKRFDLITLFHVFEHLPEPESLIARFHECLKEEGIVVISLPNIDSHQAQKFGANWLHLDPPRHLHLIPPKQLKALFMAAGFEPVSETYRSFFYNPYGYLQSWLNQRMTQRDLLYEYLKKGGTVRGLKARFQLAFSFCFALVSFPFYLGKDYKESRSGKSGTVEFVFRKK